MLDDSLCGDRENVGSGCHRLLPQDVSSAARCQDVSPAFRCSGYFYWKLGCIFSEQVRGAFCLFNSTFTTASFKDLVPRKCRC